MNTADYEADDWLDLAWSPWRSLDPAAGELTAITTEPGLYRVRHHNREGLTYIGQTGRDLRERLRALAGCYNEEMPYTDPHVTAPCLWAIRQESGPAFEVSVATPDGVGDNQRRKGIEEALIAVYRRETGSNTEANFGRMIEGYKRSSRSSDGVVGGPLEDDQTEPNTAAGIGPLPWENHSNPTASEWMGLEWSPLQTLAQADQSIPQAAGVYRIWDPSEPHPLEYIGQSTRLRNRLYRHRRTRSEELHFSYATHSVADAKHILEQIETDLIGAHWLALDMAPRDQF
ncbi:GIY-YIG nuclease family protein [Halonotius terrestris]|nr:GIY-YIG nuclease family protein [Halonotius terrestris]